MKRATLAATLATLAVACGGGTRDVEPELQLLCDAETGALVAWALAANSVAARASGQYEAILGGVPTAAGLEAECRARYRGYLEDGSIAAPAPAAVAACRALAMDVFLGPAIDPFEPGPCAVVLEGTVGGGVYCEIDEQCRGDAFCNGGGPGSCGACRARLAAAAPCTADHECSTGACVAGICATLAAEGGACDSAADCAGTLVCTAATCAAGPATTGTACVADVDCAPLLSCQDGACAKNAYTGICPAY